MVRLIEYALMSEIVYYLDTHLEYGVDERQRYDWLFSQLQEYGWRYHLAFDTTISESGYFAAMFVKQVSQEIVIANRGTINHRGNLKADLQILLKQEPVDIISDAANFKQHCYETAKHIFGNEFSLFQTGHSLGGFIAQIITALYTLEASCTAVTFDNPGAKYILEHCESENMSNITAYLTPPNLINTINGHIGQIKRFTGINETIDSIQELQTFSNGAWVEFIPSNRLTTLCLAWLTKEKHSITAITNAIFHNRVGFIDTGEWPESEFRIIPGSQLQRYRQSQNIPFLQLPARAGNYINDLLIFFSLLLMNTSMIIAEYIPIYFNLISTNILWELTYDQQTQQGCVSLEYRYISPVLVPGYVSNTIQQSTSSPSIAAATSGTTITSIPLSSSLPPAALSGRFNQTPHIARDSPLYSGENSSASNENQPESPALESNGGLNL